MSQLVNLSKKLSAKGTLLHHDHTRPYPQRRHGHPNAAIGLIPETQVGWYK